MTQNNPSNQPLQQILSHTHFKHFVLYSISFIILGQVTTCLGPMFPYLATHQNRLQTQYSFLIMSRAAGFLCGSILTKIIGHKFSFHYFIAVGISSQAITCIIFRLTQNLYLQGLFIFIASIGSSFQHIIINMAALYCFKGQNSSIWLQVLHGCFGVGGLIGPFVVYIFQLNSLTFLGFLYLVTIAFYFKLQTPQKMLDIKKIQKQDNKKLQLPRNSIYFIGAAFLFTVGQQIAYAGWISSYAVLYNFSTKEHATLYTSLFWISITFFRFAMAIVPGRPSIKIKWLVSIGIVNTFISYFIIFNIHPEFGLIFMSLVYGLSTSILYPLLLTIPQQFGFQLTIQESSVFLIWSSLGQGCLAVSVGKLMQWFSYNWLIYSFGLFNLAIFILIVINQDILLTFRGKLQESGKLLKFIVSDEGQTKQKLKESEGTQLTQIKS